MHAELRARGVACRVNTVAKVMRSNGIRAKASRRFVRTTDSRHGLPVAGNVLGRDFARAGRLGLPTYGQPCKNRRLCFPHGTESDS